MIDRELVARAIANRAPSRRVLPSDPPPAPAAVAVPIAFDPEPTVYAVLRASNLRDHAGEVGFPGGKVDSDDRDLLATALREMQEEVATTGELLGALTPVPVITGRYLIHPFVVAIASPLTIASPAEIAAILPIAIAPLLSGETRMGGIEGRWQGKRFVTPHFDLGRAVLYGASAFVLYELLLSLAAELDVTLPEPVIVSDPPWGDRY